MSSLSVIDEAVEQKVLNLFESILDLTRASAKGWTFESRSNKSGMATFGMKRGKLNVYFDRATYLLDVQFPEGDYVYIQQVHGPLKGRVNAAVSEICDVLLDSPEYSRWLGGQTVDDRISASISKMQASIDEMKEKLVAKPEEHFDIETEETGPAESKKPSLWQRLCGR